MPGSDPLAPPSPLRWLLRWALAILADVSCAQVTPAWSLHRVSAWSRAMVAVHHPLPVLSPLTCLPSVTVRSQTVENFRAPCKMRTAWYAAIHLFCPGPRLLGRLQFSFSPRPLSTRLNEGSLPLSQGGRLPSWPGAAASVQESSRCGGGRRTCAHLCARRRLCFLRNSNQEMVLTFQSISSFQFTLKICLCRGQGRINILIYLRPKYLLVSSPRFLGILKLSS